MAPNDVEAAGAPRETWRMRAPLDAPPPPAWPEGLSLSTWRDDAAPQVHALLVEAYRGGGGEVSDYETWLPWFTGDTEFDPTACFLAWSDDGELAGAALCWSSGFVKDLCVASGFRRRGLGEALLREVMRTFHGRGASAVELKVESDNPSGAWRLYERLGFEVVERLPR